MLQKEELSDVRELMLLQSLSWENIGKKRKVKNATSQPKKSISSAKLQSMQRIINAAYVQRSLQLKHFLLLE
jgi:hypothetical protein